jgi:16S rRNA (uracil1498-N3)-methyltransferase
MKKIHRFITEYKIENGLILITDPFLIHQWKNVLKFKNGEQVILVNKQEEVLVEIKDYSKNNYLLSVLEKSQNKNEPERKVDIYLAVLKKENFELALQKATEVGINSITPIITERTVKTGLNMKRLEKIAKEASELSGRSTIPKIKETINFSEIFEIEKNKKIILFDISGGNLKTTRDKELAIIIGPEGGFTDKEINIAKEKGAMISSISTLTLRGETAAIIASYLAINL